jgi:SAM-dependent methyltransferase
METMVPRPPRPNFIARARERARRGLRAQFLWERCYDQLREPKRRGAIAPSAREEEDIAAALAAKGLRVERMRLDATDFRRWLEHAGSVYEAYRYRGPCFVEKAAEHYLAARSLGLDASLTYLDVASAGSPAPDVYAALYGCRVLRQDLAYPPGVNDGCIGGDAGTLPLPEDSVDAMALHCSFEHFEGDSDSRFIRKAARVLRPGGKLCIVPLYLAPEYSVQTDPAVWPAAGIEFEPDAVVYCEREHGNRYGRFYSVEKLVERVAVPGQGLSLTVFMIENATELDPSCYVRFVALFEKPAGAPGGRA